MKSLEGKGFFFVKKFSLRLNKTLWSNCGIARLSKMQAYGAVAPSSALRSSGATAQRESKSNVNTFMALVAGVIVLGTFLFPLASPLSAFPTAPTALQQPR